METKTILKQCLGINCGKEELVCSRAQMDCAYYVEVVGTLRVKNQPEEIELEIKQTVEQNEELNRKVLFICSIKGMGLISAVTILAETNGFNLIRNKRQLVSYAGLDVVEKQSGISIQGRSRISRKGNRFIRKSLFFPALVAIRHNDPMKAMYKRLVSKHGIKMKAAVAGQKKILEHVYVLWKKEEVYSERYFNSKGQQAKTSVLCELT